MKSLIKFVKILLGAILIFFVLIFLPLFLGIGLLATIGAISWVLSKIVNQEPED